MNEMEAVFLFLIAVFLDKKRNFYDARTCAELV